MKRLVLVVIACANIAHADVPPPSVAAATIEPAVVEPAVVEATATPAPVAVHAQRRFYFRLGGVHLAMLSSSREMELADVDGAASLAISNGPIAGSGATIDSATIPGAIIGYVLPWLDRRLSVETILGLPFTVRFQATGTLATESIAPDALGIPTGVAALGPELGEAKAAPLVATLVFAPLGTDRRIVPLVGAGAAVMFTYDAHITNPTLTEVGEPEFDIAPAPGFVVQGGLDVVVWKRIKARLDIKYIAFMLARGEARHVQVRTPGIPLFESVEVGTAKMEVWVNPLVVQLGVGADF